MLTQIFHSDLSCQWNQHPTLLFLDFILKHFHEIEAKNKLFEKKKATILNRSNVIKQQIDQ